MIRVSSCGQPWLSSPSKGAKNARSTSSLVTSSSSWLPSWFVTNCRPAHENVEPFGRLSRVDATSGAFSICWMNAVFPSPALPVTATSRNSPVSRAARSDSSSRVRMYVSRPIASSPRVPALLRGLWLYIVSRWLTKGLTFGLVG